MIALERPTATAASPVAEFATATAIAPCASAPVVRLAEPADLELILQLGRRMHDESPTHRHIPFDAPRVAKLAQNLWQRQAVYIALALDANGAQPWGIFSGIVTEFWFSSARYGYDLCLYVAPERRHTRASAHAISAFIVGFRAWAKAIGAQELRLGSSSGINPEATGKILERVGMKKFGALYREGL